MNNKGKAVKGSDVGEVRVAMSAFAWRNCEKSQKHPSIQNISPLRFEPGSTRVQVRGVTAFTNLLGIFCKKAWNFKRVFSVVSID
jgi:hypothetical protein